VYTKPFDFIHARDLQGSVSDYDQLLQQAFRSLTPGGWFEFSDADIIICGDDDTLQDASNLLEANRLVLEASAQLGKVMGTARQHRRRLLDAGFTNIREETYKVSSN
jgi:predicted TPR repeat methyltransferase